MKLMDVTTLDNRIVTIKTEDIAFIMEDKGEDNNFTVIYFSSIEDDLICCKESKTEIIKKLKKLYRRDFKWV
jgi:hypothetical protein